MGVFLHRCCSIDIGTTYPTFLTQNLFCYVDDLAIVVQDQNFDERKLKLERALSTTSDYYERNTQTESHKKRFTPTHRSGKNEIGISREGNTYWNTLKLCSEKTS